MDMPRPSTDLLVQLNTRELLDITDGEGLAVACVGGVVWVTQSDDPRDIVLKAGETFILDKQGLALVAAPIGPATVAVRKASSDTPSVAPDHPTAGDFRFAA
jgi:hypothetical protein